MAGDINERRRPIRAGEPIGRRFVSEFDTFFEIGDLCALQCDFLDHAFAPRRAPLPKNHLARTNEEGRIWNDSVELIEGETRFGHTTVSRTRESVPNNWFSEVIRINTQSNPFIIYISYGFGKVYSKKMGELPQYPEDQETGESTLEPAITKSLTAEHIRKAIRVLNDIKTNPDGFSYRVEEKPKPASKAIEEKPQDEELTPIGEDVEELPF